MRIVAGSYRPHDLVEGEFLECSKGGTFRRASREAMGVLASKGLIEPCRGTAAQINPRHKWHLLDPELLDWIFLSEPDDGLLAGLFELRRIIEPRAAALAALRRSPQQMQEMAKALDEMARHTLSVEAGRAADEAFHAALLAAAGNSFLSALSCGVAAAVSSSTRFKDRQAPLRDPLADHALVFDAIAVQNPQAAHQAMADLIDQALLDTLHAKAPRSLS